MAGTTQSISKAAGLTARGWFSPALGPLLRQRAVAIAFAAAGVLQVLAGTLGFHTFRCPMLYGIGIPCPGCGASRACGAMIRGQWSDCMRLHAFAPCFLFAALLFLAAAVVPAGPRERLIRLVDGIEERTGLTKLLLVLLFVYWLMRLLYAPVAFARMMRG